MTAQLLLATLAAVTVLGVLSAPACGVHRDVGSCYQSGFKLLYKTTDNDPDRCCAACAANGTCQSWVYNPSGGGHMNGTDCHLKLGWPASAADLTPCSVGPPSISPTWQPQHVQAPSGRSGHCPS